MLMLRIMTWISLRLGRPAGRIVLHGIALYFLAFAHKARRASRDYLRRALKHDPTLAERYLHIFTFAATIHDRVYLLNDRLQHFDIEIQGEPLIADHVASGKGALLFGGHIGSFEVIRALGRSQPDLRIALAMYEKNTRRLNAILAAINPEAQPDLIALGNPSAILGIRDRLDEGTLVGVLADRSFKAESCREISLLGRPAAFPVNAFRMAAALRTRIIFMAGLYRGGNCYGIRFLPIADFASTPRRDREAAIAEAMERYVAALEQCCQDAPYNWFNFYPFWEAADLHP
ncbi:acyl-CoA synthetase [Thiorhodococcus minor]|uniref:Acyl-CoA synthetase n=2 Tax=Thiorhodococcus minor TaxID=57489 RepID=A0A6M0K4F8_9GAMM|nr:acyl-CoA synthetase [Thiorhodococcus minor]NEV63477.1 acyl-CoA synthetase [Thiorhodococcus minor]